MRERHVNWFALEKAAAAGGCPMCAIVAERTARYIDNMLFEHVSDRGFRATYRASHGFCASHSEELESYRDGLAVAILGVDVLSTILPSLDKGKPARPTGICPACSETARVEREFLTYIAERDEVDFVSFFTESSHLCVPHYKSLLVLTRRVPAWLRDHQLIYFNRLLERASRFVDCSAWGKRAEFDSLSPEDKIVWKELARALRGQSRLHRS